MFKNNPRITTFNGKRVMEKFTHQPMDFDHFDTHCKISANGKVTLTKPSKDSNEYDEIEVSASLIFKVVGMLKDTRKSELVEVDEFGREILPPVPVAVNTVTEEK